ncbi:hypothetical protein VTI74DRAFT_7376 [Chaetomium olivicolor]
MVYCGKPSKGCQMCRTRRIKCDETKPTCNQCAKARRPCPGYKDEFDLVLRNENLAAKRRALKISTPRRNSSASKKSAKPSRASMSSPSAPSSSSSSSSSSRSSSSPTTTPSQTATTGSVVISHPPSVPQPFSISPTSPAATALYSLNSTTSPQANDPCGLILYNHQHDYQQPSHSSQHHQSHLHQAQHQQQQREYQRYLVALSSSLSPTPLHIPPEDLAPCHFLSNFVLASRQDGTRGFLDFLPPLMQRSAAADEAHLRHAFNACALAALGNRTSSSWGARTRRSSGGGGGYGYPNGYGAGGGGGGSGGGGRAGASRGYGVAIRGGGMARPVEWAGWGGGGMVLGKAFDEYCRALRATQAALNDPMKCRSDGVLAAVLLLGMFENITAKQLGNLAWGSHVQGAVQLVKARGKNQLKTKVGVQLFIAVRIQLIIHTLTSGTAPAMGVDWWIHDAVIDRTAAECQRISLSAGEMRAEITRVMGSGTRTPESTRLIQDLMRRAQALDEQAAAWMASVPEAWQHRTLCWQLRADAGDYSRVEVYPGRVDGYSDFWVAAVWNQVRTTRLILMSILVRCAAWVCSPVDYRTTPEYATAARVCVDTISDILASVPYHLGWHTKRRELFSDPDSAGFRCGQEDGEKALAGYFLTWPLACSMTQDYTTDAQRAYIKGRLKYIGDELGVKYAHILLDLPVRVPSMLIRADGLLAKPYPMAHDFEKLLSSARVACPLSPGYNAATLRPRGGMQQEQGSPSDGG